MTDKAQLDVAKITHQFSKEIRVEASRVKLALTTIGSSVRPLLAQPSKLNDDVAPVYNQSDSDVGGNPPELVVAHAIWVYASPVILLVGTVGSILSLLVLCRKALRVHTTMFYLSALAVSDLMVLYTGLIRLWLENTQDIYIRLTSGAACKLHTSLVYVSLDSSVWILVAVTVDRCLLVTKPHLARRWCTIRNARIVLAVVFVLAIIFNMHFLWTYDLEQEETEQIFAHAGKRCYYATGSAFNVKFIELIWPWIDFGKYCFIPFVIMSICNTIIIVHLVRSERRLSRHRAFSTPVVPSDKNTIRQSAQPDLAENVHLIKLNSSRDNLSSFPPADGDHAGREPPNLLHEIDKVKPERDTNISSNMDFDSKQTLSSGIASKSVDEAAGEVFSPSSLASVEKQAKGPLVESVASPDTGAGEMASDVHPPLQIVPSPAGLAGVSPADKTATDINECQSSEQLPANDQTNTNNASGQEESSGCSQRCSTHKNGVADGSQGPKQEEPLCKEINPDTSEEPRNNILSPSNVVTKFDFQKHDNDNNGEDIQPTTPPSNNSPVTAKIKRTLSNKVHPQKLVNVEPHANNARSEGNNLDTNECDSVQFSGKNSTGIGERVEGTDTEVSRNKSVNNVNYARNAHVQNSRIEDVDSKPVPRKGSSTPVAAKSTGGDVETGDGEKVQSSSSCPTSPQHKVIITSDVSSPVQSRHHRSSITTTLLTITIMFWVFNAPVVIFVIGHTYWDNNADRQTLANIVLGWAVVNILQYLNNAAHIFLYCLTSSVFRQELSELFRSAVNVIKGRKRSRL